METSFLADLHPEVVHFPVALLTSYSLLEIFGIIFNKEFITKSALLLLCIGVITAFLAVLTGNQASSGFNLWNDEGRLLLDEHQTFATYLLWGASVICALRILLVVKKRFSGIAKFLFILFALLILFLVFETGLRGGNLVKRYGMGTEYLKDLNKDQEFK